MDISADIWFRVLSKNACTPFADRLGPSEEQIPCPCGLPEFELVDDRFLFSGGNDVQYYA